MRGSWSSADCLSAYQTGSYVDYYTLTPSTATTVTIQLDSSTDPYLVLYSGGTSNANHLTHNDDASGIGRNSRITYKLVPFPYRFVRI